MKRRLIAIVIIAVLSLTAGAAGAAEAAVQSITAQISAGDVLPPDRVIKRMETSIRTIGEQLLLGRTIAEVTDNVAAYQAIVNEVFSRVLVGYSIDNVTIIPGKSTHVAVTVKPWGDVIRDVSLEVEVAAVSPEIVALIKKDLGNDLEEKFGRVLIGLPVDAIDWAGNVTKSLYREMLNEVLPEFQANIDIIPGPRAKVKVFLVPNSPVVRDTYLSLRSQTVPYVLLTGLRQPVEAGAKQLRGLPVAYVERHKDYFTARLKEAAVREEQARAYSLAVTPVIFPDKETDITLNVETDRYRVWLEGYLDMGRKNDTASLKLHAGKFFSKTDEGFAEIVLIPNSLTWEFIPGWGHRIGSGTTTGMKFNLAKGNNILWLDHQAGPNWSMRAEYTPETKFKEIGVRYKIHTYLSAEYVFSSHENYLRLVGNL